MTCRFELEYDGKIYPRTCPDCGLAGKCHKGYKQIKYKDGGYALVNKTGIPPKHVSDKWKENGIPAEVLIEQGKMHDEGTRPFPGDPDKVVYSGGPGDEPYVKPYLGAGPKDKPDPAPTVGKLKLSRVQRAKLMDMIEHMINSQPPLIDIAVEYYTNKIIEIINED